MTAVATETPVAAPPPIFEELAMPHTDFLYRFALRLCGEPAMAEDLVQETMLRAHSNWHRFDAGSNVRAWLATILRNSFINEYRRRKREVHRMSVEDMETFMVMQTDPRDPERDFFNALVDEEIVQAVDELPAEYKEALLMSDLDGLPYAVIARETGAPLGTVKSRIHRARQFLQKKLFDYASEMGYVKGEIGLQAA
ncbi:MAG: sigma-70 family RNA polymerase sigma factor [Gemmatimonadota bacterium]|nr:MAG: sigma-70 family RNA polymerase sigma factor [Gemmatimonadota bacterium]